MRPKVAPVVTMMEEPRCGWGHEATAQRALLGTLGGITAPGPKEGLAGQ